MGIVTRVVLGIASCGIAAAALAAKPPLDGPRPLDGSAARSMEKVWAFQTSTCVRPYIGLMGTALVDLLPVEPGRGPVPMPERLDPSQKDLPTLDRVRSTVEGALTRRLPGVPRCDGTEDPDAMAWVNVVVWTVREDATVAWHVALRAETETYDNVFETSGMGLAPTGRVSREVRRSIEDLVAGFAEAWRLSRGEDENVRPHAPRKDRGTRTVVRSVPAR